jgi:hypothetical protein
MLSSAETAGGVCPRPCQSLFDDAFGVGRERHPAAGWLGAAIDLRFAARLAWLLS